MKRLFAGLALSATVVALSGCYVDPGYSYVRQTPYQGDAYYGQGVRTYDDGGYYVLPAYGGYYGGYGCCYAPGVGIGISGAWYGGSRYRGVRRGYSDYNYGNRGNQWRGRGDVHRSGGPGRNDRRGGGNRRSHRPASSGN